MVSIYLGVRFEGFSEDFTAFFVGVYPCYLQTSREILF
jgi:hypothetical protein